MMLPDVSTESAPIQANRVAPTPVAPPEQPAIVDDVTQTATVPADATEPPVEDVPEVKETTAPEAASSEIITEAKKEDAKRQSSPRPMLRPQISNRHHQQRRPRQILRIFCGKLRKRNARSVLSRNPPRNLVRH